MPGQGSIIGLTAKLGLETDDSEIDSETGRVKEKVEEAIDEAEGSPSADTSDLVDEVMESIQEGVDGSDTTGMFDADEYQDIQEQFGALGQDMPDRIGRPSMDQPTGEEQGLGGSLEGLMAAGGKFLKVGLAGAVGFGILKGVMKFADASPRMQKNLSMLSRAVNLFARPFYDWLAKTMEGGIMELLKMGAQFNKDYQKNGLKVAVQNLADDVEEGGKSKAGEFGAKADERLFGGKISPFEKFMEGEVGSLFGMGEGFMEGQSLRDKSFKEDPIGNIAGGAIGAMEGGWEARLKEWGVIPKNANFAPITNVIEGFKTWSDNNLPLIDLDKELSDLAGDISSFDIPEFPDWIGDIIDIFPGWIKSSPGVIDKFPGWSTWLNPLNWDVPGFSYIVGVIRSKIDSLNWSVPGFQTLKNVVSSHINPLNWNVPSLSQMLGVIEDYAREKFGGGSSGGSGGNGGGGLLDEAGDAAGDAYDSVTGAAGDAFERVTVGGMATGGLVTSPTAAVVGEAGPEVVAPYSEFKETLDAERERATPNAPPARSPSGGSDTQEVVQAIETLRDEIRRLDLDGDVYLDGDRVGEVQRDQKQRYSSSRQVTR